jgi:hypothetical protein
MMVEGVKYLLQNPPIPEEPDVYYWYYATQVMHNLPGRDWDAWNRQMRRLLIQTQVQQGCATGSWDPFLPREDAWARFGGRLYVTCLSALTLEVYYRYLPLYKLDPQSPVPDSLLEELVREKVAAEEKQDPEHKMKTVAVEPGEAGVKKKVLTAEEREAELKKKAEAAEKKEAESEKKTAVAEKGDAEQKK